jgi:hypothetical protein
MHIALTYLDHATLAILYLVFCWLLLLRFPWLWKRYTDLVNYPWKFLHIGMKFLAAPSMNFFALLFD